MKKIFALLLSAFAVFALFANTVYAKNTFEYEVYRDGVAEPFMKDGKYDDKFVSTELTVKAGSEIRGVYVVFFDTPCAITVYSGCKSVDYPCGFLHVFADLSDCPDKLVTIVFETEAVVAEVNAFGADIPDGVQRWDPPCEAADLMLCTTHADDEQLFFAGILPYYARERGLEVQVVYFTDHVEEPKRRHELLDGLWTVGVRHYPVIGFLPDEYSRNKDADEACAWAIENAEAHGITYDDLVAFQTEQIRRFKPLIAVCHDLRGEYGHGQHILNVRTFLEAAQKSADAEYLPESAERFGVWDVQKIYVHLYKENEVVMDWDTPLDSFGGLTAFQVTQKGFKCHYSQRNTWFADWLYGEDGQQTKATDISVDPYRRSDVYYSPCRFGLYKSAVGEDVMKNDFAENIETHKMKAEREEAERIAEESRRAESESISAAEESMRIAESESVSAYEESVRIYESESYAQWERESFSEWEEESRRESEEESLLESEAESLSEAAESKRIAVSESKRIALEEREKKQSDAAFTVILIAAIVSLVISTVIFAALKKRR